MLMFLSIIGMILSKQHVTLSIASLPLLGLGIGGIDDGMRFFAYRPDIANEVSNFTDFISTLSISTVTVTDYSVMVTVGNRLERESYG
jgi:hypothetical protein